MITANLLHLSYFFSICCSFITC